jgi:hypothetical protein
MFAELEVRTPVRFEITEDGDEIIEEEIVEEVVEEIIEEDLEAPSSGRGSAAGSSRTLSLVRESGDVGLCAGVERRSPSPVRPAPSPRTAPAPVKDPDALWEQLQTKVWRSCCVVAVWRVRVPTMPEGFPSNAGEEEGGIYRHHASRYRRQERDIDRCDARCQEARLRHAEGVGQPAGPHPGGVGLVSHSL